MTCEVSAAVKERPYSANPFARCPDCEGWYRIEWIVLPEGAGWWWKDSGTCPGCDAVVCVESECEFRGGIFDEREQAWEMAALDRRLKEIRAWNERVEKEAPNG